MYKVCKKEHGRGHYKSAQEGRNCICRREGLKDKVRERVKVDGGSREMDKGKQEGLRRRTKEKRKVQEEGQEDERFTGRNGMGEEGKGRRKGERSGVVNPRDFHEWTSKYFIQRDSCRLRSKRNEKTRVFRRGYRTNPHREPLYTSDSGTVNGLNRYTEPGHDYRQTTDTQTTTRIQPKEEKRGPGTIHTQDRTVSRRNQSLVCRGKTGVKTQTYNKDWGFLLFGPSIRLSASLV